MLTVAVVVVADNDYRITRASRMVPGKVMYSNSYFEKLMHGKLVPSNIVLMKTRSYTKLVPNCSSYSTPIMLCNDEIDEIIDSDTETIMCNDGLLEVTPLPRLSDGDPRLK